MVKEISAPTISKPPATKKALSKLPVALTIYPVIMGANMPNVLPPKMRMPIGTANHVGVFHEIVGQRIVEYRRRGNAG